MRDTSGSDAPARTAVVVPLYNEITVVSEVVRDLCRTFPLVICVDDGSRDGSGDAARAAGALVITHPVNVGQGAALQTGLDFAVRHTDADFVVTFDSDGQHLPSDARDMVQLLADGAADVVFGSRFLDERTEVSGMKRFVLSLAVKYTNMTSGIQLSDAHNGLRAFSRPVAQTLHITQHGMAHASEIVHQVADGGWRVTEAPVHIVYTDYSRSKGQSLWNSVNILFDLLVR